MKLRSYRRPFSLEYLMRRPLLYALLALFLAMPLAHADEPLRQVISDKPFMGWYVHMADQVKTDPNYHKIALDTDAKANEFIGWLHALYRREITPEQFRQRVSEKYPGHDNEVRIIVRQLPVPEKPIAR